MTVIRLLVDLQPRLIANVECIFNFILQAHVLGWPS